jgi:hypothetical protein
MAIRQLGARPYTFLVECRVDYRCRQHLNNISYLNTGFQRSIGKLPQDGDSVWYLVAIRTQSLPAARAARPLLPCIVPGYEFALLILKELPTLLPANDKSGIINNIEMNP